MMTAQTELDNAESSIPSIDPLQPPESVHTFRLFTAREAKEREREAEAPTLDAGDDQTLIILSGRLGSPVSLSRLHPLVSEILWVAQNRLCSMVFAVSERRPAVRSPSLTTL